MVSQAHFYIYMKARNVIVRHLSASTPRFSGHLPRGHDQHDALGFNPEPQRVVSFHGVLMRRCTRDYLPAQPVIHKECTWLYPDHRINTDRLQLRHFPTIGGPSFPILSYIGVFNYYYRNKATLQKGYDQASSLLFALEVCWDF